MNRTGPTGHDETPGRPGSEAESGLPASRRWWWTLLGVGVALLLAVGLGWYVAEGYREAGGRTPGDAARSDGAGRGPVETRTRSGRSRWLEIPAPVVTFPTLSGDTASLAGVRGQVVVLNFWATWCPPCEREIPELVRLQDSLRTAPATVVGVAVSSGSREDIRSFGEEHDVNYPVWLTDVGTATAEYQAAGLPTTLLVDDRGIIRRRYTGPQRYGTLAEDVRALLDSASSAAASRRPSAPR